MLSANSVNIRKPTYIPLFKAATTDSSYSVAGSALNALLEVDKDAAMTIAKQLDKQPAKSTSEEFSSGCKSCIR